MFGEEKNLKDSTNHMGISIKDSSLIVSYTKTDKLITALYMVTDIIDKEEPLRNKLRALGTEIISDMSLIKRDYSGYTVSLILSKITEVVSFLDIAFTVGIISEMNCSILRKEFLELDGSIKESLNSNGINKSISNRQVNLSEFFTEDEQFSNSPHPNPLLMKERGNVTSKGHTLGVQKGGTLMNAIKNMSDRTPTSYGAGSVRLGSISSHTHAQDFDMLKKQRRYEIIKVIRSVNDGATIKDIKDKARANPSQFSALISCGEKTLQRELISMVKDSVLEKTGEKRWSRYSIK